MSTEPTTDETNRTITPDDLAAVFQKCPECDTIWTKGTGHRCQKDVTATIRTIGSWQADTVEGKAIRRALDPGLDGDADTIETGLTETVITPNRAGSGRAFHRVDTDDDGEMKYDYEGHPTVPCSASLNRRGESSRLSPRTNTDENQKYTTDSRSRELDTKTHWHPSTRLDAYARWHYPCADCFDINDRLQAALDAGETVDELVAEGQRRTREYIAPRVDR